MLGSKLFFFLAITCCLFWFSPVEGQVDCTTVPVGRSQPLCLALQKFFNAANGNLWTNKNGWTTTSDYCTYQGILCYADGDVEAIQLPSNNLISNAQLDFSAFSFLDTLDLSGNSLRNAFPKFNADPSVITYINLANNQLSGLIPDLTNYISLQTLLLNNNNFLGTYPKAISTLALLSTTTCNTMNNPLLDGCTGIAPLRCLCDLPSPTSSKTGSKSTSLSKTPPVTRSASKSGKPTKTPAKTTSVTKTGTVSPTWTRSTSWSGTWTPTNSMSAKMTPTNSKSAKMTSSNSKTSKVVPVCGNGVVEKPTEQCDPNAPMDKWWQYCCTPTCKYAPGTTICQTVLQANCFKRGKCGLTGNCVKQFWAAKNGTQCQDKNTGAIGWCNGFGKCMFPSPSPMKKSASRKAASKSKSRKAASKSKSPKK